MKTSKQNRVGPRMQYTPALADVPGGKARIDLAGRVGPNGSLKYGYEIVNRPIATGLVITGTHQGKRPGRRGLLVASL